MQGIPRFYDPLCEHALFTFSIQVICKENGRFENGFSKKKDILEVLVKYLLHGWFEVQLFINLMILEDPFIHIKFMEKCSFPQQYAHCLHIINDSRQKIHTI